jgi:hypothetical protein
LFPVRRKVNTTQGMQVTETGARVKTDIESGTVFVTVLRAQGLPQWDPSRSISVVIHIDWCHNNTPRSYSVAEFYKKRRSVDKRAGGHQGIGIATGYGLEDQGSVPGRGEVFLNLIVSTRLEAG